MKNIRCYGKKTAAPRQEKSFIRNFFDGNESSDTSLFGKSSEDVLEKDSYEENKENVAENNLQSPPLFKNVSFKSLTPEKESFSRQPKKQTEILAKRNKQIKRKRNVKKKAMFHYSTKYYKSLQPRWSEIYRHDLTIERQGTNKKCSTVASRYRTRNKRILSKKSIKKKVSHFQNTRSLIEQHNRDSSECVILELSKKFNQSMKLGNFSVAEDKISYINEDLYTKSPLTHKSPISFIESAALHALKISGNEELNTSQHSHTHAHNLSPLSTKCDDVSANQKSFGPKRNTGRKLDSAFSIHVPDVFQGSVPLDRTSLKKFITSTPKAVTSMTVLYSGEVGSIHNNYKNSARLSALCPKGSPVIPYSDVHTEDNCLNFCEEENECHPGFPPDNNLSEKPRMSLHSNLLSDLCCSNKSLTLPAKSSVKSVPSIQSRSLLNVSSLNEPPARESDEFLKIKLLKLCNQDSIAAFADIYNWTKSKVKKIGEGSYGEVFMVTKGKSSCVLKIIPVSEEAGDDSYQGLQNVLSEVKISKCLSELRNNNRSNQAKNFIKLNRVSIVCGLYPSVLIEAWDSFSEAKTSYNERPDIYHENQMFVLLELEYGGKDLSSFVLRNAVEAESVLKQVATSLAVAEEEYVFEHRDLHLGNILVQRNRKKTMSYKLRGKDISFNCHGVQATLIDFTLSRLHEDNYIYYNDLAQDVSLFQQSGDYQFDVYRSMQRALGNQWQKCSLYSNVLWLKFLCKKFKEFSYSRPSTQAHEKCLKAIDVFSDQLTTCNSAVDCLTRCGITPLYFERSNSGLELTKKSVLISRNSFQKSKLSICN